MSTWKAVFIHSRRINQQLPKEMKKTYKKCWGSSISGWRRLSSQKFSAALPENWCLKEQLLRFLKTTHKAASQQQLLSLSLLINNSLGPSGLNLSLLLWIYSFLKPFWTHLQPCQVLPLLLSTHAVRNNGKVSLHKLVFSFTCRCSQEIHKSFQLFLQTCSFLFSLELSFKVSQQQTTSGFWWYWSIWQESAASTQQHYSGLFFK